MMIYKRYFFRYSLEPFYNLIPVPDILGSSIQEFFILKYERKLLSTEGVYKIVRRTPIPFLLFRF